MWKPIPLPNKIYKSIDEAILPDHIGGRIIDCYINEFGNIVKRPCFELFVDLGETTPIQGLFWWDKKGVAIAVTGGKIFKITQNDGTNAEITGDALLTGNKVSFAACESASVPFLVMANRGQMIKYNNSGTTAYIADADAPTAVSHVAYLNQRVLALPINSGQVQWTAVGDIEDWSASDVKTAESGPDDLMAMYEDNGEIVLLGKETLEIWWDTGITPAIYSRVETASRKHGCIAADSVVDGRIWLDNNRRVVELSGRNIKILSTSFDDEIRDITTVSDARAFEVNIGVRSFYIVNFPTANKTYVLDRSVNQWAEWGNWSTATALYSEFMCNTYCYAKAWGFHLLGDSSTGKIYKMRTDLYQDAGAVVRSLVRTGNVSHGTMNEKRSYTLRIRLKRGAGDSSGNEPRIQIRWKDNNASWGNWCTVSLGKMGENDFIAYMTPMGTYNTRQYEIVHTENTPLILIAMDEDVEDLGQ